MIKFTAEAHEGSGKLIGIGLSRGNCERLLEHKPIKLDLQKDFNIPFRGEILLMADETDAGLAESMREWITPETVIHEDAGILDPPVAVPSPADPEMLQLALDVARRKDGELFILLNLGRPLHRIGLDAEHARKLGEALLVCAGQVERGEGPTVEER